jgi:hypothetical protein
VLDLALPDQLLHRARDVFDRDVRVDAVLVEEVDAVGPEALQHALDRDLDVPGTAVQAGTLLPGLRVDVPAELRGDHDLAADGREGLAHELLVPEGAVHLGGVEERDAPLHGRPDERDHLPRVRDRTVAEAHSHAAEPEGRHLQAAAPQLALLHSPASLALPWPSEHVRPGAAAPEGARCG